MKKQSVKISQNPLQTPKRSVIIHIVVEYCDLTRVDDKSTLVVYEKDLIGEHMTKRESYEAKAEALLAPIVEGFGFELVDVEYVKEGSTWYLRGYIDKEGGITVDECADVSRAFNEKLDEADFIEESYIMEISSPGLGRPLKKEKDYVRSMGKELEIRTYRAINRQKEFYGILTAYDADTVTIEDEDGNAMTFAKSDISLIRLAFDF